MSIDIELYPRDQTDFSHHGYALDDISNDIVTWQLNAKFTLTFDYPMFSEHAGDLVAENIVRVPVPGGKAAFRIAQVIKSMGHLSITAYHVFWDLNDDFIADTNIVGKDGQGALDQIMRAANYPTGFKVLSTIGNVTNARLVRMSIINALLGTDDNSFLNRWGGEFDWQDFSFSVNPRLGEDRGVHFEYAHNLTGYEATKDSSGIITRLLPEGYNGLLLPELYVDSPKLGNYRKPKIGAKTYQDIKAIDETQATGDQEGAVPVQEAYELLRAAAAKEFSESHIDEAQWTYKLNVALLENTEEYKDLSITTTVLPGDTVTITHKLDGIDVRARLTGYTWRPSNHSYLTQTYDSTSRPDVAYSNLSSQVNEIKSQIELVDKVVIAKAANGMNSTGWGDQSPVDLNIAGKTGDVYYQTTANGTIMWLFHDGQWNAETGDAFGTEVQKKVDAAIADVAAAEQAANDAVAKANSSTQLASMSNQTAQAAKSAADSANALATQAVSAASDAKTALVTANSALETVTDQKTTVATLVTKTDDLAGTMATLATKTDINKLSGEVTAAQTLAQQTADGLQLKADQSVVNTINGSVNQLSADLKVANDRLSLTMTKNDVTGLLTPYATQSWTQGQITATASQFNAQFNSINQRLQTEDRPNLIYGRWRDLRTWTKNAAATNAIKSIDFANSINTISYSGVANVEVLSTDLPTVAGNQYMLTVDWTSSSFDVNTNFGWGPGVDFGFDANNFVTLEAGVTNKRYVLRFTAKGNDNLLLRFGNVADGQSNTFAFGNLNLQLDTSSQATTSQVASLKFSVDGLATTVANNQGQTTTALQTLQGFQNTATNQLTGLQSQQTQLANQITSVVGGMGQRNQLYNSEFLNKADGWGGANDGFYISTSNWGVGYSFGYVLNNATPGLWCSATSKRIPIDDVAAVYSCSVDIVNAGTPEFDTGIVLEFYPDASSPRLSFVAQWSDKNKVNQSQTIKIENIKPPTGAKYVGVVLQAHGKAYTRWQHPMLVTAATIGPYLPDSANSSQITQLQDAINLRVSKGDVLSQINLEANRTLIQSGKLVLDAPTVVFTGDAFIPSAAIANLSADKITTGTLNAANLNVINLNASAIVTGTISGANLAINLNTGEVLFQKGSIKSTNGLLNINIDNGTFAQGDGVKGMLFTQGELYLSTSSMWASLMGGGDGAVPDYGKIGFNQAIVGQGLLIEGKHVLTLGIHKDNWPSTVIAAPPSLMMSDTGWFYLNGRGTVVQIDGGDEYEFDGFSTQSAIYIGTNMPTYNQGPKNRIVINASYVHIRSAYERTTSSSPNVFVAPDGALVRSTSASKYKVNIERTRSTDLAERLLTVPNAHWLDKAASERYASGEQKELPQTNFGLIAEDLEAAGLEDLVVRRPDGELEGIQYDRIAAALLPLLAQMKTEIDELKATA
ncbi:phage tail spike protein [Lacticaseibacillus paracasei]|uniref:phage tail spike protein n=1 Tax=Lacticaseibacillus paracasei TaxID=1597 RepID=UPI001C121E37|nr:phage tail spike protein [Lacticaseibacillus paracasei]MBU5324040.1 phage tail protein [Lacticaseibacillus paracasei]